METAIEKYLTALVKKVSVKYSLDIYDALCAVTHSRIGEKISAGDIPDSFKFEDLEKQLFEELSYGR